MEESEESEEYDAAWQDFADLLSLQAHFLGSLQIFALTMPGPPQRPRPHLSQVKRLEKGKLQARKRKVWTWL